MPFRRLLKYPLLFRNLLYHTDPSTLEYESVSQVVVEVETIVRHIEEEKSKKDDRDRTRNIFERITGIHPIKPFTVDKPDRILVFERSLNPSAYTITNVGPPNLEEDSALKKDDIWFVGFSDVILRCQRTGFTGPRTGSIYDRASRVRWKNVYKFLAVRTISPGSHSIY
jgi:hypothetical protein